MADGQNLVLRIPDYQQNLVQELHSLQQQRCLCDVQLTTGDGAVEAHRTVLMASSPYLKQRFSRALSVEKESIMFDSVSLPVLTSVVDYMYTGSLHLSETTVEAAMKFCQDLQLTAAAGLCSEFLLGSNRKQKERLVLSDFNSDSPPVDPRATVSSGSQQNSSENSAGIRNRRVSKTPQKRILQDLGEMKDKLSILADAIMKQTDSPNEEHSRLREKIPKLVITSGKPRTRSSEKSSKPQTKPVKTRASKSKTKSEKARKPAPRSHKKGKVSRAVGDVVEDRSTDNFKLASENKGKELQSVTSADDKQSQHDSDDSDCDDCENGDDEENDESKMTAVHELQRSGKTDDVIPKPKQTVVKQKFPKECSVCQEVCDNHRTYAKHMKSHNPPPARARKKKRQEHWPCQVCGRLLTTAVRQACHHYSKHGIPYEEKLQLHKCEHQGCTYVTASKHYLAIHKKGRHGNERPHVCEFCGKGFKLPSALLTHLNIHTNEKVFKCPDCEQTFNQKGGLDVHIKKHHKGEGSWTELCHLCSEKFLQKADLCWHMYKVHEIPLPDRYKVFSCDLCHYQTLRRNKLERHMDAHEDKRSWTCDICAKKFVTKSYLNRHLKYHGEKSFKCDFENCNYCCVDQVGLKKHVRLMHTHKNFKPFKCSICPYKTGVRGNLDKHIRTVHNLDVVTKHTVHLKMKFKDRQSGDVLTKDGQLVHNVQDPAADSSLLGQQSEEEDEHKPFDMSLRGASTHTAAYLERKVAEQMVAIGQMQTSLPQEEQVPQTSPSSTGVNLTQQAPVRGYSQRPAYLYPVSQDGMVATSQGAFNLMTNEMRMSVATGQMVPPTAEMYNIDPMTYMGNKYTEYY